MLSAIQFTVEEDKWNTVVLIFFLNLFQFYLEREREKARVVG